MIEKEKYYTAKSIVDMGILPWKSRYTFYKKLREKKWIKIFNPKVENNIKSNRFYIKGKNINNYLKLYNKNQILEFYNKHEKSTNKFNRESLQFS